MKNLEKFFFLFFIFSSIIIFHLSSQKYCLGCSKPQAQIQAFAEAINNPSLFASDPMVATKSDYFSIYPTVLAFLIPIFNDIEPGVFLIHILFLFLTFFVFFKIAKLSFESERMALLCVFMMPFQYPMLYGYWNHWRSIFIFPTHNTVGLALGMIAIYTYLKRNLFYTGIILAIGSFFHSLSIVHLTLILILSDFLQVIFAGWRDKEFNLLKSAKRFIWVPVFFGLAGIFILKDASTPRIYSPADIQTFINVNAGDSFPLLWPSKVFFAYSSYISFLFFCWNNADSKKEKDALSWMLPLIFSSLILSLLGAIGVHLLGSAVSIILQLSRSTVWVSAFGSLFISYALIKLWRKGLTFKIGCIFLLFAIMYPGWHNTLTTPLFSIALILFVWKQELNKINKIFLFSQIFILLAWLVDFYNVFNFHLFYLENIFYFTYLQWPFVVPSFLLSITCIYYYGSIKKNVLYSLLSFAISLVCLFLLYQSRDSFLTKQRREWKEVQIWSKLHSFTSDVFITPIWLEGFRIYSERIPLVEWQDGTQQYFSPGYGKEYRDRLVALGIDPKAALSSEIKSHVNNLPIELLKDAHNRYKANFYISTKKTPYTEDLKNTTQLPVLFENDGFKVFSLKSL